VLNTWETVFICPHPRGAENARGHLDTLFRHGPPVISVASYAIGQCPQFDMAVSEQ